jgi:hypothetical protein
MLCSGAMAPYSDINILKLTMGLWHYGCLYSATGPTQVLLMCSSEAISPLGFNMGIPRVGFSHTVPEPAHTVTRHGYTRTRTVNLAVSNETRGINGTRGFYSLKVSLK